MNLKSKIEAIIFAAEEPVSIDQMTAVLKDELAAGEDAGTKDDAKEKVRAAVEALITAFASDERGIEVRKIGGGYPMGTQPKDPTHGRPFSQTPNAPTHTPARRL